jgi:hypothetical protein
MGVDGGLHIRGKAGVGNRRVTELLLVRLRQRDTPQWCGHTSKEISKNESNRLGAAIVASVEYSGDHIAKVHVAEGDESGDWNVDDQYLLTQNGRIESLSRVIDNFSLGIAQEEHYRFENGKAVRRSIKT